jgi:hypothetical protein
MDPRKTPSTKRIADFPAVPVCPDDTIDSYMSILKKYRETRDAVTELEEMLTRCADNDDDKEAIVKTKENAATQLKAWKMLCYKMRQHKLIQANLPYPLVMEYLRDAETKVARAKTGDEANVNGSMANLNLWKTIQVNSIISGTLDG